MKREPSDPWIPIMRNHEDDTMNEQPNQPQQADPGLLPDQPDVDRSTAPAAEPVLRQLDAIIENVTNYATPVLREIAARAAELAAKAGQAAGPMAQKAAERTGEVGDRVASKSRAIASDLRGDVPAATSAGDAARASTEDLPPAP
jgi:hypothetical protein